MRLHPNSCVQFWVPHGRKVITFLERVQQTIIRLVKGLENVSHREQLRELELFILEKKRFRGDLTALSNSLKGRCNQVGAGLSYTACNERSSGLRVTVVVLGG